MGGGERRSARISALEEKARAVAVERKAKAMINEETAPKRRGRKRKSLHDMEEEFGNDENGEPLIECQEAWNQSLQEMPSKVVLEFILDLIIQRKEPMFLQPSDPHQVKGNQGNLNDSKDFGAVRAKIREGAYSSMAQFECDVSLITKNPMNFSSAAMFMSEDDFQARTISELADQLFSSLRTEPEKFPSEDSQMRSDGNKQLGGQWKFYDKRVTYAPETSSKSKNGPVLSLERKEAQILELAPKSKGAYIKSYLSFLNGLGPKAQVFGSRLLTKSLNAVSLIRKWNPSTTLTTTSDPKTQRFNNVGSVKPFTYLRGARAGPVLREPPHQRSGNVGLFPHNFISNPEGSCKGKAIAVDDGMNSFNTYGGGMNSDNNCLPWERPQANNGGSGNSLFLGGITDVDTSKAIDFNNSSNNEKTGNDEDNHLLFATLWQDNSPNTSSECSYLPLNESGRFPNVLPSKMITPSATSTTKNFARSMNFPMEASNTPSPSSIQKNYAGSMMFPIQSENTQFSSTTNKYGGVMSFPIQSPNISSPSSAPSNYAGSMSFQIQSPNTPLPGIDILHAKGKAPMTPITHIPGPEYYKHPQPSTSRNITAPETPWYETLNTTAGLGFNFMDPFGEGSSNTSAFSLDKYSSKSSQDIPTSEWSLAASCGMQTTVDPPNLQAQVINQKPLPRYSFMQLLQGIPQEQDFLDETGFLEGAVPQALANTRTFWNGTPSMPIDLELNEQPDLNLQL